MALIHIERAYIEPFEQEDEDNFTILIHVKQGNDHIFAGKVDLDKPMKWLYTINSKNGDLIINNSAGMEANKWDHITLEITGSRQEHTWLI